MASFRQCELSGGCGIRTHGNACTLQRFSSPQLNVADQAWCGCGCRDVAVAAGDLAAARTAYQAYQDIAVRLAAADPANTGWQRDLSICRQKIEELNNSTK